MPGLFVGNYRDSKDAAQLDRFNITHILAIHDAARKLHSVGLHVCVVVALAPGSRIFPRRRAAGLLRSSLADVQKNAEYVSARKVYNAVFVRVAPQDKHYLCVMASDTPDQNLQQYFSLCNDFIHGARLRGGNVLIHCLAGMSRSVTVAVAYIMSVTSLSWKEALKVVRVGRAVANPNFGFQRQLQEFESCRLAE
ncbi:hypothetical protein FOCC_FOCC004302, partial [Frankliniella occidentalis]